MRNIEEARLNAGFFVGECLELFGISLRTWYRWREHGAPEWAFRLLRFQAGHLDQLGWKQWQIRSGVLYFDGFLSHGYQWEPGELLAYHWTRHNTRDQDRGALPHTPILAGWSGGGEENPFPTPRQRMNWTRVHQGCASPVPPFDGASPDEPGARPLTGERSEKV